MCIVVSPLISLMVDQVVKLRGTDGIRCAILSGNNKSLLGLIDSVMQGAFSLLFSAPEVVISGDQWCNILSEEPLSYYCGNR